MPPLESQRFEAIQWSGDRLTELRAAFPEVNARMVHDDPNHLAVDVTGGGLFLKVGWYLLRTPCGELYAMFPEVFEARYELDTVQ